MMSRPGEGFALRGVAVALVMLGATSDPALATTSSDDRIEQLESQVRQLQTQLGAVLRILESEKAEKAARASEVPETRDDAHATETASSAATSPAAARTSLEGAAAIVTSLADHLQLGGSANVGYYDGGNDSDFDPGGFQVWDTRFFVDAELGEPIEMFDTTLVRNAGLSFEWDLVRLGRSYNRVGELYVDLQGLGDSPWANLQVGRFQIPVGEAYHRYSRGYWKNPFISNPVGAPWYWDEGVRLYGAAPGDRFGYVAAITNGETPFNDLVDGDKQVSLKLHARPTSWLYLSASGLYTGELGSKTDSANGALWLGESWARAFGGGSPVPNTIDGQVVPDGPNELEQTWFAGADAILTPYRDVRLWLAYGYYDIDSRGGSLYDRALHYWNAELTLGGGLLHPELRDTYLGLRAGGLGTYDEDRGYLLDFRQAQTIGYNASSINDYSVVLGWKMLSLLTLRAEYTHRDLDFVRGSNPEIRRRGEHLDSFAIELGAHY